MHGHLAVSALLFYYWPVYITKEKKTKKKHLIDQKVHVMKVLQCVSCNNVNYGNKKVNLIAFSYKYK